MAGWRDVGESEGSRGIQASIDLLDAYQRGEIAAFISQEERSEQLLPGGFNLEEQEMVQRLLSLPENVGARISVLESVGVERSHELLDKALANWRSSHPRLVLEPYIERRLEGVTWLLERVEVGITGINVVVRLWTSWPPDASLEPGPAQIHPHLRWKGFRQLTDDTGRTMRFSGAGIHPAVVRVSTENWTNHRYSVTQRDHWRPGVAPEARSISIGAELEIVVDKWVGRGAGSWVPKTIALGPLRCTMAFPENWIAGKFTPVARGERPA